MGIKRGLQIENSVYLTMQTEQNQVNRATLKRDVLSLIDQLETYIQYVSQNGYENLSHLEKQLTAVNASIRTLENQRIPIPNDLRDLKLKLTHQTSEDKELLEVKDLVAKRLTELLTKTGHSAPSKRVNTGQRKRDTRPKTENTVFREYIIKALKGFGGSARMHQVLDWMEEKLDGKLTPRDLSLRKGGEIVWRNNAQWERYKMIQDGILKSDSPHGIWELTEDDK